ncbi:MAG: ATP-binding protein [Acidimicrobiales bacterium]
MTADGPLAGKASTGTAVKTQSDRRTSSAIARPPGPAAEGSDIARRAGATERRLVTVLFCDLVGFTSLSENRDPEEVRELLSSYFDLARSIIGRYGGTIEKFVGDAVMAVWGAPFANEDDAERAVRAGLDLSSAIREFGSKRASTELSCRIGIVTGQVATTEVTGEGLVIGDRVNTAARIQSVAPPGGVYVDEQTRHVTSAAIAYLDRGEHQLKGKSELTRIFEATRVISLVAGAQRSGGIDAPFVGRDAEFRHLKELFHTSTERSTARLVLVSGVAGIGKSRLAWEFLKYADGLAGQVLWHSGRCLSYGEGVSYWALSEMVRSRLQIAEDDPGDVVLERLRAGVERWIEDPGDRELIAPRLGQLLGLAPERALSREELFSGWRLFFERLSEHLPVVMVVEDLQWADPGLLAFLDHLLEWSGQHPIFLLVLSRSEGTGERGLRLSRRNITTLPLDALPDEVIGRLLDGVITGLPEEARSRIVERAEGIPLYAIETVRALLDKGQLEARDDGTYELVGEIGELDNPPGLTALISSRLDSLDEHERRLVKQCAILGGSFSQEAVAAVSGVEDGELLGLLGSLVRKEVLTVRADRHSPEIGQYAFTQSLIRSVAHDMLSHNERKTAHLAAASYLTSAFPDEGAEVAEVIASHLHEACRFAGTDETEELKAAARTAHRRAAERAEVIGAPEAAESAYLLAFELAGDELEGASLLERAGEAVFGGGWFERSIGHFGKAIEAHRKAGQTVEAARVTAKLGRSLAASGRAGDAATSLQEALSSLDETAPPDVLATVQLALASSLAFSGEDAHDLYRSALTIAQHHDLDEILTDGLLGHGLSLAVAGRDKEAGMYFEEALASARRLGSAYVHQRALANLGDQAMTHDRPGAEQYCREGLSIARSLGNRASESLIAGNLMYVLSMAGRFEEGRALARELFESGGEARPGNEFIHYALGQQDALRGDLPSAESQLAAFASTAKGQDAQTRTLYPTLACEVALLRGDPAEALEHSLEVLDELAALSASHESMRAAFPVAVAACVALGQLERAESVIGRIADLPTGEVPPFLKAQVARGRSLVAAARGESSGAIDGLVAAEEIFESLEYPYWLARTRLEHAEHLTALGRLEEAGPLALAAEEVLVRLGVAPMAERAQGIATAGTGSAGVPVPAEVG